MKNHGNRQGERRCRRSEDPKTALRFFLESAALRLGFEALIIGDDSGNLVAASSDSANTDRAAEHAPALFRHDEPMDEEPEEPYFIEVLPSARRSYFLTAVGGRSPHSLKSSGTLRSIRRIMDI